MTRCERDRRLQANSKRLQGFGEGGVMAGVTRDERDRLRALAKRATPGPWESSPADPVNVIAHQEGDYLIVCEFAGDDGAYIAAADPPTVTGLLDALDAAEARADLLFGLVSEAMLMVEHGETPPCSPRSTWDNWYRQVMDTVTPPVKQVER